MLQERRLNSKGEQYVVGPTGTPLTLHDLPPANTDRWVIRRKAEVVAAVRGGLISLEDALARYRLTAEEFLAWQKAIDNGFAVGTYEELIPSADLVLNLTPDKQHSKVVTAVMPLMKKGACLSYSHGFNIVEEGMQIREDLTVIMVAPKGPGDLVRREFQRGRGDARLSAHAQVEHGR